MRSPLFVRLYGRGRLRSLLNTCPLLILLVITPVANASSDEIAFDVSGSFRVRYESLNNPIFPTSSTAREQSNQRLSTRFIVNSTVSYQNLAATIEIRDSRVFLDENDPTLTANQVNTLEPTQFFITYKPERESGLYEVSAIKVGRMELDYGSRRLLAKTAYRNATNSYDGIVVEARVADWQVHGVYVLPVSRFPTDSESLDGNERAFDKSFSERKFFGVYAASKDNNVKLQSYWLKEDDSEALATKNRDLYTLSVDYTQPFDNGLITNIEVVGQTGTSYQTASANDTVEKDVRAYMLFGYVGKQITDNTFLRAEVDYISGDNDTSDDTISDFDTLYGVRRFDFGPTDVYQAMPRRNLKAVGLRSVSKPAKAHNIMLGYKAMWYQKAPQDVNSFIGHQVEARWRYQVRPELRLVLGGAYLKKGEGFARGDYSDNSAFLFTGALYTF
ncbi:MAG TPA: hypothetical protein DCZ37_01000 [Alteromonas macleodii]|uniref:Alginate export domain-containing protein n=1 Tax=Alteromonas australica TaxID=589873 RepID=A0A358E1Y6_9ALTE|nr:alginate export family protein [Alteromonas macleodii]HBA56427.1 hypothetical protein [Alteromonas macleodii]HBU52458.1 hypothetical protein [Alteromonas australica]|tara:strand:- start:59 stop:1396 length:1338 start_codon:yes stop_codon:yes gene_type:complete